MFKINFITILFISLFLAGCSSTSNLYKQTDIADKAFATGDFKTAYNFYNTHIEQQIKEKKEISGEIYCVAAKSAFQLNKIDEAEAYFKQAYYKHFADAEMYDNMISIYKKIDNLSREIDALEFFVQNFESDSRFFEQKKRLFETYIESENWVKANVLWADLREETQSDIHFMEMFLKVLQKLDNSPMADKLAEDILIKNTNSKIALEQMAEKYFWKAENDYQAEMTAYENNKSNKQYNIMVNALDGITADFKKSLKFYETLYKLYPSKEYAKYMANIYVRFQDKKNTDYYRKLSI